MKSRMLPLLLVLLAALGLAGCTNISEVVSAGLRIELVNLARGSDGTVQVTWRLRNPNVVPYLIDRSTHKVTLNGVTLGTFADATRVGIQPQSVVERTDALVPANGQVADKLAQLAAAGTATYRVDSTVWILIVDDQKEKASLVGTGTVAVTAQ
jgi:LEA14-like dessication related protein